MRILETILSAFDILSVNSLKATQAKDKLAGVARFCQFLFFTHYSNKTIFVELEPKALVLSVNPVNLRLLSTKVFFIRTYTQGKY